MPLTDKPIRQELTTVTAMIRLYCRGHHQVTQGLCQECQELLDYATLRLDKCRFGANKPTCAKCPVHCYKPEMRTTIQKVMRYAGPRMLLVHPAAALRHLLKGH